MYRTPMLRSEYAYREIRKRILAGEWQPGQRLSSYELSNHLKVSRTPVMEAMKALEQEGFVVIEPQVGCVLKVPNTDELKERFLILKALEGLAVEEAAARILPEEVEVLSGILAVANQAVANHDSHAYEETNRAFHLTIAAACQLPQLSQLIQFYFDSAKYFTGSIDFLSRRLDISHKEHQAILEALKRKDGKLARELIVLHSKKAWEELAAFLQSSEITVSS